MQVFLTPYPVAEARGMRLSIFRSASSDCRTVAPVALLDDAPQDKALSGINLAHPDEDAVALGMPGIPILPEARKADEAGFDVDAQGAPILVCGDSGDGAEDPLALIW